MPSILAIITARGGSKRLPGKNLRRLSGKSLMGWTIEAAQRAESISRTIVSSEDPEIIAASLAAGAEVPFIRPQQLATDAASSIDVVGHALDAVGEHYDMFVLLQPTSPLRLASDIDHAVSLCRNRRAPSCVSVSPVAKPPSWIYQAGATGLIRQTTMSEDGAAAEDLSVVLNGAIYVAQTDWFRRNQAFISPETVGYVMPRERSVDIDDELDFILAETLLERRVPELHTEAPIPRVAVA